MRLRYNNYYIFLFFLFSLLIYNYSGTWYISRNSMCQRKKEYILMFCKHCYIGVIVLEDLFLYRFAWKINSYFCL